MMNNFTTQFTELMYKFKDLLPNSIIYKSNQIKLNMQHEINQSLKFSQSEFINTYNKREICSEKYCSSFFHCV